MASDAGNEPATVTVTWANSGPTAVTAGNVGVSVTTFPTLQLDPGYQLVGTIVSGHAGDRWTTAAVWADFTDTP